MDDQPPPPAPTTKAALLAQAIRSVAGDDPHATDIAARLERATSLSTHADTDPEPSGTGTNAPVPSRFLGES